MADSRKEIYSTGGSAPCSKVWGNIWILGQSDLHDQEKEGKLLWSDLKNPRAAYLP